jgi:hypothetical protein
MHLFGAFFRQSSNVLEIRGLKKLTPQGSDDDVLEEYQNDAIVTVTLNDPKGIAVEPAADLPGGGWPVQLPYVAASNGRYALTLPFTLDLSKRGRFRLAGSCLTADGLTKRSFDLPLEVLD